MKEEAVYEQIKYGDIEYFELLHLRDLLSGRNFNKLGLLTLDKMRHEIHIKIERIHLQEKQKQTIVKLENPLKPPVIYGQKPEIK